MSLKCKILILVLIYFYFFNFKKPSHIRKDRFVSPSAYQGIELIPEDSEQVGIFELLLKKDTYFLTSDSVLYSEGRSLRQKKHQRVFWCLPWYPQGSQFYLTGIFFIQKLYMNRKLVHFLDLI